MAELKRLPTEGWITNGGDLFNRRFSPLTQINRDNVGGMQPVWRTHLNGSGIGPQYSGEAQPIVYDGVIYVITGADDVFALSVDDGTILWIYEAKLDPAIDTICCGWTSRGVAIGDGKIFVGQLDGKLVALNQASGQVIWSVQTENWQDGLTITSAPLYYDGLVITGFAGAEYGVRGRVKAHDADDGSVVWTFFTIPGPGEAGHNTWPVDNAIWQHGGASVWQTPAVDPELGLLYFATGNPGPDLNGSYRRGDNLFTSSILAIEAATGRYRWHFQQVHHDIWDFDSANPVVLFDIELHGTTRKAIVEVSKTGWAYILDRTNGQPLLGIEERPVMQEPRQATAATQPFPVGDPVAPHEIDVAPEGFDLINSGSLFTPFWTKRVVKRLAGPNWPPSAYDPRSQTLFVCASDRMFFYSADDEASEFPPTGEEYYGGVFGSTSMPATGLLVAMDMRTNRVVWSQRWPNRCYSGITATAGNLLFVGRNDGRLTAQDSRTGTKLWEFRTDAGMNAPPSVFEYDGTQYIAVLSAGNLFVGSQRGDSVWLFALPESSSDSALSQTGKNNHNFSLPDDATLASGRAVFARACQSCHGASGEGAHNGDALTNSQQSDPDSIKQIIRNGRNQMPSFENGLNLEEINAVTMFVLQLKSQQ